MCDYKQAQTPDGSEFQTDGAAVSMFGIYEIYYALATA